MYDLIYQIYKINKYSKMHRPVNNMNFIKNKTEPDVNLSHKLMSESIQKYIRKLDDNYKNYNNYINYNKNNNIYKIGYNNLNSKYKCNAATPSGYIFLLGLGAFIFLFIRCN
jgi:hypothetical protein